MNTSTGIAAFLKFTGLSGMGWLLDLAILLLLVSIFNMNPSQANTASSCIAALAVFLLSRELIFRKAPKVLILRTVIYLTYTLSVIAIASVAIGMIVSILHPFAENKISETWTLTVLAGTAKVIVTPPQLIMNFFVSRFLSERQFSRFT